MKKKILIILLAAVMSSQISLLAPSPVYAAETEEKKANLLPQTQCVVREPNFDADASTELTPGTTFKKDPYISSTARYDAYCFVRVEVPTTTFTFSDGSTIVSDAVKMLYNDQEGINTADWKIVKTLTSTNAGTNTVYILEYAKNNGILTKQAATGRIFDSMLMPSSITVSGSAKKVVSAGDVTGAVSVTGYMVSVKDASSQDVAYQKIKTTLEAAGGNSSNSNANTAQGSVDMLTKEKADLETQVQALEERIGTGLSTGNAKANEVVNGKVFSTASERGVTGTMPVYDKGYYGAGSTSDTYQWTDLDGVVHTENKEGYQQNIESGTGLIRNSDGTIQIVRGYHASQVIQGASGTASASQVLSGKTFSTQAGNAVGTMGTIVGGTSNSNSDIKIQNGTISITAGKYTGDNTISRKITSDDIKTIITTTPALTATAEAKDVILERHKWYNMYSIVLCQNRGMRS